VVRAAASVRHDPADGAVGASALELEALAHFPAVIGDDELEHGLGGSDAHDGQRSGRIHLGLFSVER